MIRKWLTWVNLFVGGCAVLLVLMGFIFLVARPSEIPVSNIPPPKTALPKKAFTLSKECYDAIGEPLLNLRFAPMSMQLPDLKRYLLYYGKNGRPDAVAERPLLHFCFTGNKNISSASPGEKLYVQYDRRLNPPQYVFSPDNRPSPLWIEATAEDNEAKVKVTMKGENGELIQEPECHAQISIPEKEFIRAGSAPWEIGKNRVDATLLARQRARWYGSDIFMEHHGGKEYADRVGKERIDFGEGEDSYSTFIGPQDSMIWENDRWKAIKPGRESLGKPLLVVKKIEDRLMTLELWDPEGKGKITLNILRSSDIAMPVNVSQVFKFVGARTRTQFMFEVNKERVLLSPKDWFLLTKTGWAKLVTPQEIDDYVERKTIGPLFVFDEIERKEDKQILKGSLYNGSRTSVQPVEILLQQSGNGKTTLAKDEKNKQKPSSPPLRAPREIEQSQTSDYEDDEDIAMYEDDDFDEDVSDYYGD